jgi:DNA invertase Pin-like site-specific DNA recombinase
MPRTREPSREPSSPRTRRIGISYRRFSDPQHQAHGDSDARQERLYRDFCQQHNLTPLTETFLDRGRSGYHDEHRKKGNLGVLIEHAKAGRFDRGAVIVVETWDRLGRLRPDRQTELVAELVRTGVSIGICKLNEIFSEDDFGTTKWTTLAIFIQLAYQESKQKAERIAASYQARRQLARAGKAMTPRKKDGRLCKLITDRLPYWLECVHGEARPIPERVAALKRIFALAAQGQGRSRIIAALIREKIPHFGTADKWTTSYVNRILSDQRVLGIYQPKHTDGTPDGTPIADYYPRVISDDAWHLSRAGQEQRRGQDARGRALVRSERKHVNLFRSLLTNASNGEGFFLQHLVESRPNRGATHRYVLACAAGPSGRGKYASFPYDAFEQAMVSLLREVNPRDVLPNQKQEASRADVLRAKLDNIRHDIASLQADLKAGYSKALAAVLRDQEAAAEETAGQLQDELAKTVRPVERAWKDFPTLADLIAQADDPDEARLKLRAVLRRLVEHIQVLIVKRRSYLIAAVQVYFSGGGVRDYLIVNQNAGYHRPGGWWVRSLADMTKSKTLDLRQGQHVQWLEKAMEQFDLDSRES